jgi:hypothetical protein
VPVRFLIISSHHLSPSFFTDDATAFNFGGRTVRLLLAITAMLMLGGCGIANRIDTRAHYQQSLADYRACLAANEATPQACEGKRLLLETDEKALANSGMHSLGEAAYGGPGGPNYDITVRNR